VVLSYNRGPESVRTILRELRNMDNYSRNFWTLLANRNKLGNSISAKEAGYVPTFFAAAIIGENPQAFELFHTTPLNAGAKRTESKVQSPVSQLDL